MTRKKIFLIPALFLCSIFTFLTFSCSSGLNDESGEVSFTFTEPMLRKIISRDAGSSDDPYGGIDDYGSEKYGDYGPKIRVELTSKGKTYIKETEIIEVEYAALGHAWNESPDMPEGQKKTYLLLAYSDDTYKIQEIEDGRLLSIVSEGSWKQNFTEDGIPALYIYEDGKSNVQIIPFAGDDGFEVKLNETPVWFSEEDADEELADFKYLPVSVSFKNLPRGAKAKVYAEIFANEPHGKKISLASGESSDFIIESNTVVNVRMKINYYLEHDDIDNKNDKKTVYSAQAMIPDDYLNVFNGGWLYFNAYDDGTYDIVGDIYDDNIQPVEKRIFAKGTWEADDEKNDFLHLYEQEYYDFNEKKLVSEEDGGIDIDLSKKNFKYNGWSAVELHFKMSGYEEPENPSEEELVSPGGTITAVYNGTGTNGINEKTPYQLVIFNDTEYAIYEAVDNQGKIESKGAPICFGTCSFTSGEGDMFSFDFKEKAYLKDDLYTKSSDGGNHKSNTDIYLHSASGLEFVFYLVKDIPASGTIASDNRALLISLDYAPETISLNNGKITFVAAKADGSELTAKEAEIITWTAEILYKGNDINSFNEEIDYYSVEDNYLSWNAGTPLPSAANYQIYVTATWPVDEEAPVIKMNNSQTFDIYIQ